VEAGLTGTAGEALALKGEWWKWAQSPWGAKEFAARDHIAMSGAWRRCCIAGSFFVIGVHISAEDYALGLINESNNA
jgi:hypothetical protein